MSGVNLSTQALTTDKSKTGSKPISEEYGTEALIYGRKLARWLVDGDEVYVRDNTDIENLTDYTVEYRRGRFGPEALAELENLEDALEKGEEVAEQKISGYLS
ncbi:MAG: hypothetical protein BRC28_03315 [Nanohaloarchaea archaeon SW_4_43_9]|nr:MAG: hypothetical protein BRC28_03315 [Nanohaloarchaea archaeon SW_4_43_9]